MAITSIARDRIDLAKTAYTARRVDPARMATLVNGDAVPRPGDLVLARVVELGQHDKIEFADGRRGQLFPNDEIVVCFGNRYAPDQFEAEVPPNLRRCHLVAGGGVAGRVLSAHPLMKDPTTIKPIGLVADAAGRVLNARQGALAPLDPPVGARRPKIIVSLGTSMNAGKTTSAAYLVHGLTKAGLRVGAAKVTGTGAGKDVLMMKDAGAVRVYDFTDAGYATTYLHSTEQCLDIVGLLTAHLAADDVDAIVLEVADGLYQRETKDLVCHPRFRAMIDSVMFAAGDAIGGVAGVEWLQGRGLPVVGLSGMLTASPLAIREAQAGTKLPVWDLETLAAPAIAAAAFPPAAKSDSVLSVSPESRFAIEAFGGRIGDERWAATA